MKKYIISNKSFTLIEILISIGILGVLTTTVAVILNPAELMKQSRDAVRVSNLQNIDEAVSLYIADGSLSAGSSSVVYVSLPDTSPTCNNLGLPPLGVGWSYKCSTAENYKKVDGSGWIPVNLTSASFGSFLSVLPVDSINSTSTYYTYVTTGRKWKLMADMESTKYLSVMSNDQGLDNLAYETGNDLSLEPESGSGINSYSFIDDGTITSTSGIASGGGFGNGTISSTTISGSGTGANINLGLNSIAANTWTFLGNAPTSTHWNKGLASDQNGNIYTFQGSGSTFWKYSVYSNAWTTLANTPEAISSYMYTGWALISDQTSNIYAFKGGGSTFWRYSIASSTWTTLASAPAGVNYGAALTYDQATDNIYAFQGNGSIFWKYSIASSTWTTLTSAPLDIFDGSNLLASGQNGNIYAFRSNSTTDFWKYSIASSTWTTLTNSNYINSGGSMIYDQQGNIYVHRGQSSTFWRYSIASSTWTTLASAPSNAGAMAYYQNEIYALKGQGSNAFWKYSIIDIDNYYFSGAFESAAINLGAGANFTTISWDATLNGQIISFKARSDADGNFSNAPAWSSCSNLTNGGNLSAGGCVTNGHQYIQYQTAFSTSNGSATPSLNGITINYSQ